MSVSVISRPKGYVLSTTPVTGSITESYPPYAIVRTQSAHGLVTGDVIYIRSRASEYNGFWQVAVQNSVQFVLQGADGSYVPYNIDANITYYTSVYEHGWNCGYLPIVYKLSNDIWPNNFVDPAVGVVAFDDVVPGYVRISTTGSLGTFLALDFIEITNADSDEVNGVWQITSKLGSNNVVLNLVYDAGYSFSGAVVQLYKKNYRIVVNIRGGIDSHELRDYNRNRQLVTLRLTPDENNEVKFSVHEIIQSTINLRNDLLLSALPNNTNMWTEFFIQYGEAYDISDGTTVGAYESALTTDSFTGQAAAAKLNFKNVYSGNLSEYVMINSLSKFLTIFAIPVFFAGSSCSDCDECYSTDVTYLEPLSQWSNIGSDNLWSITSNPTVSLPGGGTLPERSSAGLEGEIINPFTSESAYTVFVTVSGNTPADASRGLLTVSLKTADNTGIQSINVVIPNEGLDNYPVSFDSTSEVAATAVISIINVSNVDQVYTISFAQINGVKNIVNPDSPCHQDISFILDYRKPSIPNISAFQDIGIIGNNPMTGDPFENRPWTNNPGGSPPTQYITPPDDINPSNFLAADIENPPADFVHHFRLTASGSVSGGGGETGQIVVTVYEKATNTLRGFQSVNIPNGMGLLSYPINITGSGFADQVRIYVYSFVPFPTPTTITVGPFGQNSQAYADPVIQLKKAYSTRTDLQSVEYKEYGLYRVPLDIDKQYDSVDVSLLLNGTVISETKTIEIDNKCSAQYLKLSWLNNLGGFEYWSFTAFKDNVIEIGDTGETSTNLITSWPESYGEFADTEKRRQTFRESRQKLVVRSQSLTREQADAVATIKSSVLVQIVNTVYDKRTVILDKNSFTVYNEGDKQFGIQFEITYTDDISSQTV